MIISAKEAQRLSKTKWQAELQKLDILIKNAIWDDKSFIFCEDGLCPTTIDYLKDLGYGIAKINNIIYKVSWSE